MVILVSLLCRLPELSREEFLKHHRERHAPMVASTAAARRYVRRYTAEYPKPLGFPGVAETRFEAVVRQWFDSPDDIQGLIRSTEYRETIRPDEQRFIDMSRSEFYLTEERVFLGDADVPG
ncbi:MULTISPECIES: EthD domain-containing protein [unclassified Streptomyces]|uniref:EthD domain-containing protein n=1 Tax=unclassified Streptomyces TaxID=2593676 RepID=UPI002DDAE3B8|nr:MULTISPECIES: EthD domain-containing protein [unclassified Streptomyces]WSA91290.1 EthD domain-containing protein [Streptomyces sp. NBC_01795]WSS16101.1 EthD domain-containing protein [Streptomyces sp. NBC_01186]WSS44920.1 EthD domain-containing protein [Streptomyces sp. NBC_01187]